MLRQSSKMAHGDVKGTQGVTAVVPPAVEAAPARASTSPLSLSSSLPRQLRSEEVEGRSVWKLNNV